MAQKFLNNDFFYNNEKINVGFYMEHRQINMHSHEFWEISYVYEGRGTHYYESGVSETIREGELVFLSPNVSHCITSPQSEKHGWVRVCNMLIQGEYIDKLNQRLSEVHEIGEYSLKNMIFTEKLFCVHLKDEYGIIYNLLMTAAHEYRHFSDCSNEIIENSAASILMYIIRLYEKSIKNENAETSRNDVINDIIKYIKSNFGSDITLYYLAEYVHLSPEYLCRYFKKCTGVNISEFITKTRIEKAKCKLRTSDCSINDNRILWFME